MRLLKKQLPPLARIEFGRAGIASELVQNGAWFKDLKSDLLGLGLSREFGRTWLSLPDQEGPSAGTWKGVFLDHVFGGLLKKAPASVLVFESPALMASWAFTVPQFKGTEFEDWKLLLKRLSVEGSFAVEDPLTHQKFDGRYLSLRGRKIAWVEAGDCTSLSLDPYLAARGAVLCRPSWSLKADEVGLQLQLDQFYPAIRTVRQKVAGLESESRVLWRLSSDRARLEGVQGEVAVLPELADRGLGSAALAPSFFRTIPASTLHLTGVALRAPDGFNFSPSSLRTWLTSTAPTSSTKDARVVQGVLAHLGYRERKALSVLLVSQPVAPAISGAAARLANFASGLKSIFKSEKVPLGIRAVCQGAFWAISPVSEALDEIEETCAGKRPNLGSLAALRGQVSTGRLMSLIAYANPGQILVQRLLLGMAELKADLSDPTVLDPSRELLGRIPAVWLSGVHTPGQKTVLLKASE